MLNPFIVHMSDNRVIPFILERPPDIIFQLHSARTPVQLLLRSASLSLTGSGPRGYPHKQIYVGIVN
jgi:hypothetical protein